MSDSVITRIDSQGLATITLNKPTSYNAYDDKIIYSLITALDDFADHPEVKVLLINAEGKHFCSGVDARWLKSVIDSGTAANRADATHLARLYATLYHFPVPTIASVNGNAYGGALGLISGCDIVITTSSSHFYLNEANFGLAPAICSPYLVKSIGERAFRYHSLTARPISAHQALKLGLVSQVVEPFELKESTELIVEDILKLSPIALRQTKAIIQFSANEVYDDSLVDVTIEYLAELRAGADCKEGLNAFLEKRSPEWLD